MKLCITASNNTMDARVDTAFGRALYFQIIDTESMAKEVIRNSAATGGEGAGITAARQIADKGTHAVLTGVVGINALNALRNSNIRVYEGASNTDTVQQALDKFLRGEFKETSTISARRDFRPGRGRGAGQGQGRGLGRGGRFRGQQGK
jgi:predicted Fe-Mo cluster-binding NifX family protein